MEEYFQWGGKHYQLGGFGRVPVGREWGAAGWLDLKSCLPPCSFGDTILNPERFWRFPLDWLRDRLAKSLLLGV